MPGLDDASGRSTPVAIPSPTPGRYPMTPDQLDEAPAHVHASPSFDYHEERRLHLKDEIWLSHHLPRIPPAAIAESQQPSPSASASVRERTSSSPKSYKDGPQPISTGDVLRDPSPSAFHPKGNDQGVEVGRNVSRGGAGMGMAEEADEEEEEQGDQEDRAHGSRSIQNYPVHPSSMDTPSGPAGGDLDPRPTLLHRGEVDSQEQLDLQEEAQERLLEEQTEAQGLQAAFRLPATSISNSQVLPQPGESLRSTPTPPPSFCSFPLLEISPPSLLSHVIAPRCNTRRSASHIQGDISCDPSVSAISPRLPPPIHPFTMSQAPPWSFRLRELLHLRSGRLEEI